VEAERSGKVKVSLPDGVTELALQQGDGDLFAAGRRNG